MPQHSLYIVLQPGIRATDHWDVLVVVDLTRRQAAKMAEQGIAHETIWEMSSPPGPGLQHTIDQAIAFVHSRQAQYAAHVVLQRLSYED